MMMPRVPHSVSDWPIDLNRGPIVDLPPEDPHDDDDENEEDDEDNDEEGEEPAVIREPDEC